MSTFFISPYGEIIRDEVNHISIILHNPEKFGLTREEIIETYKKFNEKTGTEGKAREEIILNLVKQGWIRARKYDNKHWTFNINRLNNKAKDILYNFVSKLISGFNGDKEKDMELPVHIISSYDLNCTYSTFGQIAVNSLYN